MTSLPHFISPAPRNLLRRLGAALAGLVFVLFAAGAQAAQWTYMVYIGGDNNLSEAAISDIQEMLAAQPSPEVNIVVQVELGRNYSFQLPAYIPDYNTHRLVIANRQAQTIPLGANLNMADPATLRDFVQWGVANFPASHYALTIWDHGAGWKDKPAGRRLRGAVEDESSGGFMTLPQLADAVGGAGTHLDLVNFDACLMGMYEVAYQFSGLADYLVASEEVEPGNGDPYTPILNGLAANPTMSGADLSRLIVHEFVNSYVGGRSSVTKSAVALAAMPTLHQAVEQFAATALANLSTQGMAILNARNGAQHYEYASNIDLADFLGRLAPSGGDVGTQASALAATVAQSVVASEHYSSSHSVGGGVVSERSVDGSHGIAIFLPSAQTLERGELDAYASVASSGQGGSNWYQMVAGLLGQSGGTAGQALGTGGFAYAVAWLDNWGRFGDADLDLYVIEPNGGIGAPYMGQTTANGYFSPDSADSGNAYEIYAANDQVMQGPYLFVVNYYADGYYDDYAHALMLYMDYPNGVYNWTLAPGDSTRILSLYNPAPAQWTDEVVAGILYGYYSDWWIPTYTQRALQSRSFDEIRSILLAIKSRADARRGKGAVHNLGSLYCRLYGCAKP